MRGPVRAWLVAGLLLATAVSGLLPVAAQTAPPGEPTVTEPEYAGGGNVTADGTRYLWLSSSHAFEVTVAASAPLGDRRLCLLSAPEGGDGRDIACRDVTVGADGAGTVSVAVERWPEALTGEQSVRAVLRAPNASTVSGPAVGVTVIRTDGDLDGDGLTNEREASLGTDLDARDTDGDGLADGVEVEQYGTSPTATDTDGDGLDDDAEIGSHQTDPTATDTDGDGLADDREVELDTSPNRADTDGDGLDDAAEVNTYDTNATTPDTDGDGLADGVEVEQYGTSPTATDTDGDGIPDNREVNTHGTDPTSVDTDGDGLADEAEVEQYGTDPAEADTDGDGLTDGAEVNTYGTDPTDTDSDGDGLTDGAEVDRHGTDPLVADTDGDGRPDGAEVARSPVASLPSAVALALAALGVVGAGLLYWSRRARTTETPSPAVEGDESIDDEPTDRTAPSRPDRGGAEPEVAALLGDEDRVLALLDEHDGRMPQSEIVARTDWSKSKVSRVLSGMAAEGRIVKIDVGRQNVIVRPDRVPPGARSPFED
jgi:hypothetical protein